MIGYPKHSGGNSEQRVNGAKKIPNMGYLVDSSSPNILWSAFGTRRNRCVPNAVSWASEELCEALRERPCHGATVQAGAPERTGAPRVLVFNASFWAGACRPGKHIWWLLESTK